ncbi:hypothetical protein HGRIS_007970 [Hohenbuehelia grisea]|uniref:Vesicular-fusion protein SEC17 n=1 Tax=Hohenbuehelia grisea TaxID=104357 RepID=A0ABR3J6R6_9AGAR
MPMHGKPNAARNARRRTKRQMHGGTLPKRSSVDIQTVSLYRLSQHCTCTDVAARPVAIQALTQTITHLTQGGRFRQAADREKEIGQIYLQESNDIRKACESFERAGDWYAQEDATATANACYKDAADLHADLDEYPQAIQRYEQVADHSLSSALTKYSVKEYWLRALLCALAMGDPVTAKRNMGKYANQDTTFSSTREAKFINVLIEAVESGDQEVFTGAVVEFDQVTKLDNWKTAMLLKIKRSIHEEPGLT